MKNLVVVVIDAYLLPLITRIHGQTYMIVLSATFFNLQNIIKGRLSKESAKENNFSECTIRPMRVHISSFLFLKSDEKFLHEFEIEI